MWRSLVVVAAMGAMGSACSEGLSAEEDYIMRTEAHKEATFTVTYDWVYESPNLGPFAGTRTWYQDGRSRRIDWAQDGVMHIVIGTEAKAYECSTGSHRLTGKPGCYLDFIPASTLFTLSPTGDHMNAVNSFPRLAEVVETENREIAGLRGKCFSLVGRGHNRKYEGTLCFSEEGIVLRSETPNGLRYEATNIKMSVPEGIFEPPMEVTGGNPLCGELQC